MIRISIDAMGGDHGPQTTLPALATVAERRPDVRFLIFGDESAVRPILSAHPALSGISDFVHCEVAVRMDAKPSQALRQGRWKSSMWKALEAVKSGEADACISAGNTGALMAMAKFCLRTMADIERPAIAAIWPTMRGESIVLDVGATIGADAQQLVDFAILGAAMAKAVFDVEGPTVGLLNVGVEEIKGQEEVREAGRMLREAGLASLNYHGFVEGDDIGRGTVDVIVTEGFSGNIALKVAEGTARQIGSYLRDAMGRTMMARLGYIFARGAFKALREKMDVRKINGGVFLGLNGLVVKSHGGADEEGFAAAKVLIGDPKAILFIDEIHNIIGAGATSGGTMDAANILKPPLSNGELRCIGSTTFKDYRQAFERDRALSRRFQRIDVGEPTVPEAIEILKGLKPRYEDHHGVKYTDAAIEAAVELSARHISGAHLPDKAIDVIDETGAKVRLMAPEARPDEIRPALIEEVVAKIARIPTRSVSTQDKTKLANLDGELKRLIFGQDQAIEQLSTVIKLSRAGLGNPDKPTGCFLFAGPTGVGKTELAKQLAATLGVEFIRFDMSEYMEKHTVSRLIGAPPGYVGFDQGGQLTDAINKHPYSVVLLDEIEKAHPDLYNILLQVMDHATLTDNNGRKSDFRNVILIMSSNAGSREMAAGRIGFGDSIADAKEGKKALERVFTPEFRNRLDATVFFTALPVEVIRKVARKFLDELDGQLAEKKVQLEVSPAAVEWFVEHGYDKAMGARPMARLVQSTLKAPLANEILFGKLAGGGTAFVDAKDGEIDIRCEPAEPAN